MSPILFNAISDELNRTTTDRAVAVLGASIVETALRGLVHKRVASNKNIRDWLLRANVTSLRNMAFAVGLISNDLYVELKNIAEIRNKFAHTYEVTSFDDGQISLIVDRLIAPSRSDERAHTVLSLLTGKPHTDVQQLPRRNRFIFTIAAASFFLQSLEATATQIPPPEDDYSRQP